MKKLLLFSLILCITQMKTFAQSPIKIACIGNSITEGPGREHEDSYPLQLGKILGEAYEIKNFGVSGRTLLKKGDFPFWVESQFEQTKEFQPDILLIKLGTNDTKPQNWKYKDEFKRDYIELISTMKQSMPTDGKVYVVIPVPVFRENFSISPDVIDKEMRTMLYEISISTGSEVIDLYTPLLPHEDLFPDGVHPNTEGLSVMAKFLARAIRL